jgi:microcystin-dependent protein
MGEGYLTPNAIPADTMCRVLIIPNSEELIAVVTGALNSLIVPESWTEYGALTPEQSADALSPMFDGFCFAQGVCRVIGEIICYAGSTSPDANWLGCDGASLLRADYPDLFAVVGTAYGSADGAHFNLPDLRGRSAVSMGQGTGLTNRALGDFFGEETHTLITSETPSHSHVDTGHTHGEGNALPSVGAALLGVPIPSAIPGVGVTGLGSASIANTGGDGAHNNLSPSLAVNYLIVAKQ